MMSRVVVASLLRRGASHARHFSIAPSSKLDFNSDVRLQEARTWDEGVSSQFATTPLSDIFQGKRVVIFGLPGAFTGVCTSAHVPSYANNFDKFKANGVDSVICVSVNDPYALNAWAENMGVKEKIKFYADYDAKFHNLLGLECDLSKALLGKRSQRWSAFVHDGVVKCINVESQPSDLKVSDGESMLKCLEKGC